MDKGNGQITHGSHQFRSVAGAQTRAVFAKGHIAHVVQGVFNGIITNDKFCMSRRKLLELQHASKGSAKEIQCPPETNAIERPFPEETDETTRVDRSSLPHRDSERQAPMAASLPVGCPMECNIKTTETSYPGEHK
jgi:hypothetical protein